MPAAASVASRYQNNFNIIVPLSGDDTVLVVLALREDLCRMWCHDLTFSRQFAGFAAPEQ